MSKRFNNVALGNLSVDDHDLMDGFVDVCDNTDGIVINVPVEFIQVIIEWGSHVCNTLPINYDKDKRCVGLIDAKIENFNIIKYDGDNKFTGIFGFISDSEDQFHINSVRSPFTVDELKSFVKEISRQIGENRLVDLDHSDDLFVRMSSKAAIKQITTLSKDTE